VVRFPHGAHRLGDGVALRVPPRPARDQVPDAAAEVGTAEQRVNKCDQRSDRRNDLSHVHLPSV
jgi:hypothetical protein